MISLWGTTAGNLLMTFIISMVPVIELRGAIPLGVYNGLDVWTALVVAFLFLLFSFSVELYADISLFLLL